MRASRHVFMSFEDFFGDQDTFVSDQTSERRPPSVQTREKHATWNFFSPNYVSNNVLIVSLKRLPRVGKPVSSQRKKNLRTKMFTLRWTLHFPPFTVFGYFRVPWRKSLPVIYGSGNWNRQAVSSQGKEWKVSRERGSGRRLTFLPSTPKKPRNKYLNFD